MHQLIVFAAIGVLFMMSVFFLKWSTETDNLRSKKIRFWIGIAVGLADSWLVSVIWHLLSHSWFLLIVAALVTATAVWAFRKTGGIPKAQMTTPTKG